MEKIMQLYLFYTSENHIIHYHTDSDYSEILADLYRV